MKCEVVSLLHGNGQRERFLDEIFFSTTHGNGLHDDCMHAYELATLHHFTDKKTSEDSYYDKVRKMHTQNPHSNDSHYREQ